MDDGDEVRTPRCHVAEMANFFAPHDRWLAHRDALMNSPPRDVGAFTDSVFAAEGMDPGLHKQLRSAVRKQRSSEGLLGIPPDGR